MIAENIGMIVIFGGKCPLLERVICVIFFAKYSDVTLTSTDGGREYLRYEFNI